MAAVYHAANTDLVSYFEVLDLAAYIGDNACQLVARSDRVELVLWAFGCMHVRVADAAVLEVKCNVLISWCMPLEGDALALVARIFASWLVEHDAFGVEV
jgi:hypothetical protein